VIRSTLSLKSYKTLASKYDFLTSPEFLREKNYVFDANYPSRIIVGYETDRSKAQKVIDLFTVHSSTPQFIMTNEQAVKTKLAANFILASRVVAAHTVIRELELDGQSLMAISEDPRIGKYGLSTKTGFGAGGKCFIKDMHLINEELNNEFINDIIQQNYLLLETSDKDAEYVDKYKKQFIKD
jgi:UDPglucose 6-dehydrogenase